MAKTTDRQIVNGVTYMIMDSDARNRLNVLESNTTDLQDMRNNIAENTLKSNNLDSSVHGSLNAITPDFINENAVQKVYGFGDENARESIPGNYPLFVKNAIGGCFVKSIKANVLTTGYLTIGCYKTAGISVGNIIDDDLYVFLDRISTNVTGVQTLVMKQPVYIPNGYTLAIGSVVDSLCFAFGDDGLDKGYYYREFGTNSIKKSIRSCGVDVFCIDALPNTNDKIKMLYALGDKTSEEFYNGYDAQNSSISANGASPLFPYPYITNAVITGIKANIYNQGTLSVGIYKKAIVENEVYDPAYYERKFVLNINQSGEKTIMFPTPLMIPNGCYLAIGQPSDTASFMYGQYGFNRGYTYTKATDRTFVLLTERSLGIVVYGVSIRIKDNPQSIYKGKRLSIYGDSISTFAGWIPQGNAVYYTGSNAGMYYVDDTWWMKTIKALQMELLVNNSWSGRAVSSIRDTQQGHTTDAGYKAANVGQLKSGTTLPEVIIIKLGINDFNLECPLGDYNGSTAVPTDPSTFAGAYAMMLNQIMTQYPLAKVFCCTLMPCEKNGGIGFPEINGNGNTIDEFNYVIKRLAAAFGAKVIDHNSCGITYYNLSSYMGDYVASSSTGLHPNADGHSLIANETINEMDNAVRTRY